MIANEKSIVRALYKRDECEREESGEVVDQVFKGSLPQFVTAFCRTASCLKRNRRTERIAGPSEKQK